MAVRSSRDIDAAAGPLRPSAAPARRWILSIGIDTYAHWPRLRNAVNDAMAVASQFARLGYQPLCPPLTNAAASAETIRRLVLTELPHQLGEDDSLVIFFAGHGHLETTTLHGTKVAVGYAIPCDGHPDQRDTWLSFSAWLKDIARLPPRHILVILDCCHSGTALDLTRGSDAPSAAFEDLQARRSRRVIASAFDDQRAMDAGPLPAHSLFTGCLLDGLGGGLSALGRTSVTGAELGTYLQRGVIGYPASTQTPAVGTFDLDDRGDFLIFTTPLPLPTSPGATQAAKATLASAPIRLIGPIRVLLSLVAVVVVVFASSPDHDAIETPGSQTHAKPPPSPENNMSAGSNGSEGTLPVSHSPPPSATRPQPRGLSWMLFSIHEWFTFRSPEESREQHACAKWTDQRSSEDTSRTTAERCPVLSIDDIQAFKDGTEVAIDVRLRNSSAEIINVTRAILDTEVLPTPAMAVPQAYYKSSHTYIVPESSKPPLPRAEFPVAHFLPPASVDSFKMRTKRFYGIARVTLVFNGHCRVYSRCLHMRFP